ncbi:hypothetical protein WV31_07960 [Magnetospirillum sp. ME-1]|uniref:molybdate ABC transporter substrate-binding protein n=1 Tax=Magnetospirillum sp. ME-1 TaxID=1639348 RepID=UPI000A17C4D2|nr:substrate-binding domain-containing protein [Magnetospirillum sp. ME-1]ARJ65595.1 hypothetical protein WV31_07960 [Magnetospirillum sp. ME-1]
MLNILATQAVTEALNALAPQLEEMAGEPLCLSYGTSGGQAARLRAGEPADLIMVAEGTLKGLAQSGLVDPSSCRPTARAGLGISVREGAPHPDIASPEAFRQAMLDAASIAYPDPADGGASGIHFAAILDRLGIAEMVRPRSILVKAGGECGHEVAEGKAELAVQMISELLPVAGTELVGPFPAALQNIITFSSGIVTGSRNAEAVRRLIAALGASRFHDTFVRTGLEPISAPA